MTKEIKLSFCVAYDWYFLQYSLPLVYHHADQICLAIDKDRISWAGKKFHFDEDAFRLLISKIDTHHKIKIYEDDFHLPELSPMGNEIRQRKLMAEYLGVNGAWYLQLDSDEYFLNFEGFVAYLKKIKSKRPINICCPWITLYKRVDEGFLMIKPTTFENIEFIPIATNLPTYEHGRRNGLFNHYTNFAILHQSWARSSEEVWQKLNNWGHNQDFDIQAYFQKWESLNADNYKTVQDFHPFKSSEWERLELLKGSAIEGLVEHYRKDDFFGQFKRAIKIKNSIWVSRFRKYLTKK